MNSSKAPLLVRYLLAGALGFALGIFARRPVRTRDAIAAAHSPSDSIAAASGIAALHRADSIATISGDPEALAALFDSAGVRQEPGAPAVVTPAAMLAEDVRFRVGHSGSGIVRYAPHFEQTSVFGDRAVEWGYFDSEYIAAHGARPESFRGNVLRIMRREPDGSWKFTHVMWNLAK
jgi:hypothetical protein